MSSKQGAHTKRQSKNGKNIKFDPDTNGYRSRPRRNRAIPQRFQALTATPTTPIDQSSQFLAFTAVDLDILGNPLKYSAAISGPDADKWLQAAHEEIDRLLDSNTIKFIPHNSLPRGRTAAYYNPQVRTKEKKWSIRIPCSWNNRRRQS